MTRIANIRIERVHLDDLEDTFDIELEDNETILRAVLTNARGRGYSGGRDMNIYILTDPVSPEEVEVGGCSNCGQPITQDQAWLSDKGVYSHVNPAHCITPYAQHAAEQAGVELPVRETHDLDQQ